MAEELGKIVFKADTSDLERGSNALDKLGEAGGRAATSADTLNASFADTAAASKEANSAFAAGADIRNEVIRSYEDTTKELQGLQKELVGIRAKVDPVGTAFDNLAQMSNKLQEGLKQGLIAQEDYDASIRGVDSLTGALEKSVYETTEAGRAAKELEKAEKTAAATKAAFITKLREQSEIQGKSTTEILEYKAAQLGATAEAAPLIAALRAQEANFRNGAVSAGQYRLALRRLPAEFTSIAASIAGVDPLYTMAIQQANRLKASFGGVGGAAKAVLSTLTPATSVIGLVAIAFGSVAVAANKSRKEIAEANRVVKETIGVGGDYAEKLALNIRQISEASSESIENISKMFITTKDGASASVDKLLAVGFSYDDAKQKVKAYKDAADFTALNTDIENHKLEVLGIKNAWSDAAEEIKNYYTAANLGKQSVALGGAIDPITTLLNNAKQLNTDITEQSIRINQEMKKTIDLSNKEFLGADRVAGAQEKLRLAIKSRNKIANSGDVEAIANANKLVKIREKELTQAKKKEAKTPAVTVSGGDRALDLADQQTLALKAQLKILEDHSYANEKISQQRKDLLNTEAQIDVLTAAAGKRNLSANEKSILAAQKALIPKKEELANLGDQILAQQRLNDLVDYGASIDRATAQLVGKRGLSDLQAQKADEAQQLLNTFIKAGGDISNTQSLFTQQYLTNLDKIDNKYNELKKSQMDWSGGIQASLGNWLDDAENVANSTGQVMSNVLDGAVSNIADALNDSKADWKSYTVSILKMIEEIILKLTIAATIKAGLSAAQSSGIGWLSSLGGALAGSAGGGAAAAAGGSGLGAMGLPTGFAGYSASLPSSMGAFAPAATAISPAALPVAASRAPMAGLSGGGNNINIQTSVAIDNSGGQQQQQTAAQGELVDKAMRQQVIGIVSDQLDTAMRQGGRISSFVQNKSGR